jgi:hypothetical protein
MNVAFIVFLVVTGVVFVLPLVRNSSAPVEVKFLKQRGPVSTPHHEGHGEEIDKCPPGGIGELANFKPSQFLAG